MRFQLCLATALSAALVIPAAAQQDVGVASAVRKDVSVKSLNEELGRAAAVGTDIKLNDLITSGDDSAMQVLLLDETMFTVGPRAEMVVDEFVYDPNTDAGEMTASVTRGAFRFMSGRTAKKPENVEINTPVASMGIRGTIAEGAVGRDAIEQLTGLTGQFADITPGPNATVIALRGPGEGSANNLTREGAIIVTLADGRTVTLTKVNTAVYIPGENQSPIGPFPLPEQSIRVLGELTVSVPSGPPVDPVPDIEIPSLGAIQDEPVDPLPPTPEDDQIVDRPTLECGITDGIPVTGPGLNLGGSNGQTIDDFGSIECVEQ